MSGDPYFRRMNSLYRIVKRRIYLRKLFSELKCVLTLRKYEYLRIILWDSFRKELYFVEKQA